MWRLYARYGRAHAVFAVVGVVSTLFARSLGLLPPVILGVAIDTVFLAERPFSLPFVPAAWLPADPVGQLWVSAAIIAGAFLVSAVGSWASGWGWNGFAQRVQHAIRVDTYRNMQALDAVFFDEKQTGELMSILSNDVNQLESFLNDGLDSALRLGVMVVGIAVVLFAINPQLALVAMLPVPLLAVFTTVFVRIIQPKYAEMRASVGRLNSRLENNLGGITVIKTETAESFESNRVATASREYFDANWDAITTRITFFPMLNLVTGVGFVVTFAVGGWWVVAGPPFGFTGALSAGAFVTFIVLVQQFIWPMAQFGQIINMYQRAKASSARVFGLMDRADALDDVDVGETLDVTDGVVEFDDVSFAYPDRPTIDGVDARVDRGELLGVVGPTGAGKSTLLKLLVRLYEVDTGAIRIDGTDIRDVSKASLRRNIGYVGQEPFLFYGTVAENISYGTFDATTAEIEAAARAAAAHEFIAQLPDGYDTMVGERGVKLSGGQRQRIAIARAILKDPAILVLDEATSHVDTETEALIQRALASLAADRTTIAVAHRLSTVRNAARLIVVDDGRVVETGTHDELVAADGLYANLWRVQIGEIESVPAAFVERAIERAAMTESTLETGGRES